MQRRLTKQQVDASPYEVWNAFVDLLGMERYEDLAPDQRAAQLVFWYWNQIENGGHYQYFENSRGNGLDETVAALGELGATCQRQVLRDAVNLWRSCPRNLAETVEEFCDGGMLGEFSPHDARFYACSPSLFECLEAHLRENQSSYVRIE